MIKTTFNLNDIMSNPQIMVNYITECNKYLNDQSKMCKINVALPNPLDLINDDMENFVLIYDDENFDTVGFVQYSDLDGDVYINYLFVPEKYRDLGYGKQLVSLTKGKTVSLDCLPKNKKAQAFYKALGFKAVSIRFEKSN